MAGILSITGVASVLRGLDVANSEMRKGSRRGAIKAGLIVLRQAQINAPVDTSNLKSSGILIADGVAPQGNFRFKTEGSKTGPRGGRRRVKDFRRLLNVQQETISIAQGMLRPNLPEAIVGFGAYYAIFVHELHPTKRKFLLRAVRKKRSKVKEVIAKELGVSLGRIGGGFVKRTVRSLRRPSF